MKPIFGSLKMRLLGSFAIVILLIFIVMSGITARHAVFSIQSEYIRWTEPGALRAAELLETTIHDYHDGLITQSELNAEVGDFQSRYTNETGIDIDIFIYESPEAISDEVPFDHPFFEPVEFTENDRHSFKPKEHRNTFKQPFIISTVPIMLDEHKAGGYIQTDIPREVIFQEAFRNWLSLFGGFFMAAIAAIVASLLLAANLSRPLSGLSQSAGVLAGGNLSHRIVPSGPKETREVAGSFNKMADSLEAMLEEQRSFAANASHELRTPVTNIRLRTEAMLAGELTRSEELSYLKEMDEEAQRMGVLIEDLILLSRFDAGRAEIGSEKIDLVRFAVTTIDTYRHKLGEKYTLSITAPEKEIAVRISLSHLTIIFRNLLENAIKYSPHGGVINWKIHVEEDYVVSTISDTGMGIPDNVLAHLFERFYQGDISHSRDVPGSGLGLALVWSVLQAYSGDIKIISGDNKPGTTAVVRLPIILPTDIE